MTELADSIQLAKVLLLIILLILCSATDLSTRRIPNAVLLPALITALFLNSLAGGLAGLMDAVAGLAIGIVILMPLYLLGRMGAGDLKLLGVVGSVLGAWGAVVAGLATMMAGGLLGVAYLFWILLKPRVASRMSSASRVISKKSASPNNAKSVQITRAAEIPYAVAIAAGTSAALIYLDLFIGVSIT